MQDTSSNRVRPPKRIVMLFSESIAFDYIGKNQRDKIAPTGVFRACDGRDSVEFECGRWPEYYAAEITSCALRFTGIDRKSIEHFLPRGLD